MTKLSVLLTGATGYIAAFHTDAYAARQRCPRRT
jgi:thioester reductase-like protein